MNIYMLIYIYIYIYNFNFYLITLIITVKNDILNWHFTIRGPKDTGYENGIYHGKIEFPNNYPMSPPNIIFMTV